MLCKLISSIDKVLQLVNEIQEWEVQTEELGRGCTCWSENNEVEVEASVWVHCISWSFLISGSNSSSPVHHLIFCLCPWQGLLVCDAQNKKCWSATAVLLTC